MRTCSIVAAVIVHACGANRLARWLSRAQAGSVFAVRRLSRSGRGQADGGGGLDDAGCRPRVHRDVYDDRLFGVVALIIIGREIAVSALREWMAEIGKRRAWRCRFVGKIKTVVADGCDPDAALSWHALRRASICFKIGDMADLLCRRADGVVDVFLSARSLADLMQAAKIGVNTALYRCGFGPLDSTGRPL